MEDKLFLFIKNYAKYPAIIGILKKSRNMHHLSVVKKPVKECCLRSCDKY